MATQSHKITYTTLRGFVHAFKVVRLVLVFFMELPTHTLIKKQKYDSKNLLNQRVKIWESSGMVTGP